jgi:hypothetical protein
VFSGHLSGEVRFQEEKTEHAELYPYVLGLVAKDTRARLEAFEEYRRAVVGRHGGGMDELDRAYGLSFISSIGMIGKTAVWNSLQKWVREITSPETVHVDREAGRISKPERIVTIAGPEGSGKLFVINRLKDEADIRNCPVWVLGERGDYKSLVGGPEVEPAGIARTAQSARAAKTAHTALERFIVGWQRLAASGSTKGAILVADTLESLTSEEREFLDYLKRRIEIALGEGDEPGIFIVITDSHPRLDRLAAGYVPRSEKTRDLLLTHPHKSDVDEIIEAFRGRTVGNKDLQRLTA